MNVAIVAPCPIPYAIGGAENLSRGLQDYINEHTEHQAEILKLPSRELSLWALIDTYARFAELDLTGFDIVVTTKYPAWMVRHRGHVVYMLHRLRGLYDTYPSGLDRAVQDAPADVEELLELMAVNPGRRGVLEEVLERLDDLRDSESALPARLTAFPGPFARAVVHWLDSVGLDPANVRAYGAISATVRDRRGYFPAGAAVTVVHPPTGLAGLGPGHDEGYIFTASRLEAPKRVDLLVDAMRHASRSDARLVIAGTGPAEDDLRERARGDERISFLSRVSGTRLAELYARSRAVAFVPADEDYGLIAVEAMACARPVLTVSDAGGPTELIDDGETGLVVDPAPAALGAAIDRLTADRRHAQRMGAAARLRAGEISWQRIVDFILAA